MAKINGPNCRGDRRKDGTHMLQAVMAEIDRETEVLHIKGDVPTNDEWEALGQHFTKLRFLKVATGWDEDWTDAKFPLNWPLELLIIADAIAERITTPAIMEGRINHLVLLFACGLRFEGPLVEDLLKDAEPTYVDFSYDANSAAPTHTMEIYSIPGEWARWLQDNHGESTSLSRDHGDSPPSAMKTLDILGNDAFQMLAYVASAKFHLLTSLENLTLYSTSDDDLPLTNPSTFLTLLPSLTLLKQLKITLGSPLYARILQSTRGEPFLGAVIPANIETLRLRGPVSATAHLDEFAAAFGHANFLPNLKRISLLFDLPDESSEHRKEPSLEQLRAAHKACRKVLDAATARGVVVETFEEPWVECYARLFREVDNRWYVQDSIAKLWPERY
ncbi:uncharacterized protein B0H64DRAFT_320885 [Chaetomium fimeti]|uniref:Uncharacterized protein n=1 Tax=Chaetomium fimeti TaxID=1854472 RepID=A0AAE0LT85_9PEZI|nr:hypothetical protein B0H64DRAFT_320885 [Chaetomium fimeti]